MTIRPIHVALAAAAAGALLALRRGSARRAALSRSRAKRFPVERWEGEGGALPRTGSHMGPSPVLPESMVS